VTVDKSAPRAPPLLEILPADRWVAAYRRRCA
jgi:hypothetical protein